MGNLQRFEDTLVSVLENQPERSEVVVVTNRPYEDPYRLRGEVAFVEARPGASLLECFAEGLAASHAAVVHLIAAGVEATPGWAETALARFGERDIAAVAPLVVDRVRPQRILTAGLRYSGAGSIRRMARGRRLDRFATDEGALCGPELQSAFYRREALAKIASLPDYGSPQAAAVELALALRRAGYRCVQEPQCLTTAVSELFDQRGWREGIAREQLYRRWASAHETKASWLAHAALLACESLQIPLRPRLLGRLGGRAWAALGFGRAQEIVIGACAASQLPNVSSSPRQLAAADNRAA
jgi:hypothetical protein